MTESKIRLEMTLSFFSISHFKAYKYEKTAILENENVTRGGGVRKVPKTCHVLFEWPLFFDSKN